LKDDNAMDLFAILGLLAGCAGLVLFFMHLRKFGKDMKELKNSSYKVSKDN